MSRRPAGFKPYSGPIKKGNATRFPPVLSTKMGRWQHRVKNLDVLFDFKDGRVWMRADWKCGNGGGTTVSPLMWRSDLPLCVSCEMLHAKEMAESGPITGGFTP